MGHILERGKLILDSGSAVTSCLINPGGVNTVVTPGNTAKDGLSPSTTAIVVGNSWRELGENVNHMLPLG